jgi:hypothetical protein
MIHINFIIKISSNINPQGKVNISSSVNVILFNLYLVFKRYGTDQLITII